VLASEDSVASPGVRCDGPERRLSAHKHQLAHVMPWTPCLSVKPTCPYWPRWICRTCSRSRWTRLGGWWRINMPALGDATARIGHGRILSSSMSQRRRGRQLAWPRAGVEFQRRLTWEEQGGQHVEGKSAPRRLTRPQQARRWNPRIQLSTHQQRLLCTLPLQTMPAPRNQPHVALPADRGLST
jgi:hypothetical protein